LSSPSVQILLMYSPLSHPSSNTLLISVHKSSETIEKSAG
jgi:hypothetical protein